MPSDFEIRGTDDLRRLSNNLAKEANGRELRKDLLRNIRLAAKPAVGEVKSNLRTRLPQHGGLAAYFGRSTVGVRTRLSGRSAGVTVVAQKRGNDMLGLDQGLIRHPLFGKPHWYSQKVPEGLISGPLEDSKNDVRRGVLNAIDATANRITRSV